jgi:hypothetical protein
MNVELHIERLVLDGVELGAGDLPHLHRSVVDALTELLRARGLAPALAGGASVARIFANDMRLARHDSAARGLDELGSQIAGSIYGGIGRD